jgi:hypothetical protein
MMDLADAPFLCLEAMLLPVQGHSSNGSLVVLKLRRISMCPLASQSVSGLLRPVLFSLWLLHSDLIGS